jgi:hypothetical protein
MPPKKTNTGRKTRNNKNIRKSRRLCTETAKDGTGIPEYRAHDSEKRVSYRKQLNAKYQKISRNKATSQHTRRRKLIDQQRHRTYPRKSTINIDAYQALK